MTKMELYYLYDGICCCLLIFVTFMQKNKVIPMETISIPANITRGNRNTTLCIQCDTSADGSDRPVSRGAKNVTGLIFKSPIINFNNVCSSGAKHIFIVEGI